MSLDYYVVSEVCKEMGKQKKKHQVDCTDFLHKAYLLNCVKLLLIMSVQT